MEMNQGEKSICSSLRVDTKSSEINSGDREYSMDGDASVIEKVGMSGRIHGKEQIQTLKSVDNGEKLDNQPLDGSKVNVDKAEPAGDGLLGKEITPVVVKNCKGGLPTGTGEVTDSKELASTSAVKRNEMIEVSKNDANGNITNSTPLKKGVAQTKREVAGLCLNGKEEHINKNKTPGSVGKNNLKNKRKRMKMSAKKKLMKQKLLLDHGDVASPSEMPKSDFELKKVEEQLEANAGDEVMDLVVPEDENNVGGQDKVVIKMKNTNEVVNTNSGSGIKKRSRMGEREVQQRVSNRLVEDGKDKKETKVDASDGKLKEKMKEDMTNSISEDASRSKSTRKGKSSKELGCNGMIFMCTPKTKEDCYRYGVFGLPSSKKDLVFNVLKGEKLFLFDVELRLLYGIYIATAPGGYNIEPAAFNSNFPSQVRFTIFKDCFPVPEEKFKNIIKDNYFTKSKFNSKLTCEQVNNLCNIFKPLGKAKKLTGGGAKSLLVSNRKPERTFRAPQDGKQKDKKRSRAQDNVRQDRKRSRGQYGSSLAGSRRTHDIDSRQDFFPPLHYPPRQYAVHESQAYIPHATHHSLAYSPPATHHSLAYSPPATYLSLSHPAREDVHNLSPYTYQRVDRNPALDYHNQELTYGETSHGRYVAHRDPYTSNRDHQVPYPGLREAYSPSFPSIEG